MKKIWISLTALALVVVMAACGNQKKADTQSKSTEKASTTITVKDSNQKEVKVPKNPKKVVVFDYGTLDNMDQLGLSDRVVGASTRLLPDFLKQYKKVKNAGDLKEPDLEAVHAMKPDLIIISGRQESAKKDLEKIAPTLMLNTDGKDMWGSIKQNVKTIGTIFDKEKSADTAITKLEKKMATNKEKAEKNHQKALMVMLNEGQLATFGKGSRYSIVFDAFGYPMADKDIKASTHGQSVTYEYVVDKNPDILFVVDRTQAIGGDDSKNNLKDNELIQQTKAYKNNKVINLDAKLWYLAGGGLHATALMLDDAAKALK